MKILVVDDDDDSAALLVCLLERQGWSVDTSSTAEAARRALRDPSYEVLVTDLYLPDGLGLSLLEPSPPKNLRAAILVTGAPDEPQRRKSQSLGFHRCFAKPLNGAELVSAIRALATAHGGASS